MWCHFTWIEGPHRVAIMQCPSGGEDLDRDLGELRAAGVDVLASMMEPKEATRFGLADEAAACRRHGIEFFSFPVPDHGTPASAEEAVAFANAMAAQVRAGHGVVFHCFAGIGRSATMALVTLRVLGIELNDAVGRLRRARGLDVPETDAQLRWVASLPIDPCPP